MAFVPVAWSSYENDLFPARRLFLPWPRPVVHCPQCEDVAMRVVAVRVRHAARETVIDAEGVRVHRADAHIRDPSTGVPFEVEVSFQCGAHESVLRITREERGCLSALVEVQRLERLRTPMGRTHGSPRRHVRTSVLRLIKSETTP